MKQILTILAIVAVVVIGVVIFTGVETIDDFWELITAGFWCTIFMSAFYGAFHFFQFQKEEGSREDRLKGSDYSFGLGKPKTIYYFDAYGDEVNCAYVNIATRTDYKCVSSAPVQLIMEDLYDTEYLKEILDKIVGKVEELTKEEDA